MVKVIDSRTGRVRQVNAAHARVLTRIGRYTTRHIETHGPVLTPLEPEPIVVKEEGEPVVGPAMKLEAVPKKRGRKPKGE